MEKRIVLKSLIFITSIPFRVASNLVEFFNWWEINRDIEKCVEAVKKSSANDLSPKFIYALIAAEDKRNSIHYGVDPFAIARAIYVRFSKGQAQGASTIEQQFVRVISERFERSLSRKIREQILAISVAKRCPKWDIAKAYLSVAFFGSGIIGIDGMQKICSSSLENVVYSEAIEVVSRLKYPEPLKNKKLWFQKHSARNEYITLQLISGAERIGLTMSESDQLHPEQSTTAIVVHHPQARYFTV